MIVNKGPGQPFDFFFMSHSVQEFFLTQNTVHQLLLQDFFYENLACREFYFQIAPSPHQRSNGWPLKLFGSELELHLVNRYETLNMHQTHSYLAWLMGSIGLLSPLKTPRWVFNDLTSHIVI